MVENTFVHRDEHGIVFTVSLQFVLYAHKPLTELARGAVSCFNLFRDRFGDELERHDTLSMRRGAQRYDAKARTLFASLCRKPGVHLPSYWVFKGSSPLELSPPVFSTGGYAAFSWLQVQLPLESVADWRSMISAMGEHFPFRCGTVGLSLCWSERAREGSSMTILGTTYKRYPGLNLGTPQELCDQGLPPVNWVTLLGPDSVEALGGFSTVRRAFAAEKTIAVEQLANGVSIRAGDRPRLGIARSDLDEYRKVGSFVKALRGTQSIELHGLTANESKKWLARLDR